MAGIRGLNLTEEELRMPVHRHQQLARHYEQQADRQGGQAATAEAEDNRLMDAAQVHRDAALQPGTTAANIARLNRRAANAVRQARTQRATAERLRGVEMRAEQIAQRHSLAAHHIMQVQGQVAQDAHQEAYAHRRAHPDGTRTHDELVAFHSARLAADRGLPPHVVVGSDGQPVRITHKPVAGVLPAHSWLAKTIRKARTGHPHGTRGGRRTRRHRRSKRRRTRRRRRRRRTRRRHKRRRRRRRRR